MSKILSAFFAIITLIFSVNLVSANNYLKIISREQWGADENYTYIASQYWKDILTKRIQDNTNWNEKWATFSQSKKDRLNKESAEKSAKTKKMNNYLSTYFSNDIKSAKSSKYDGKNKLAWPINKTNTVKNIVIHHTYSEYKDSYAGIKKIHKYHSLNNQWGDIGYHYVIGYNGEIFEGRKGGDYVVGAHDTWNNYSTVGISLMGNYDKRHLSEAQYISLKKLVSYLTEKYGIDLNKKIPYHRECFGKNCINGLETHYYYPIVGHKDGKATACPGHNIYEDIIPKLIKELQPETSGYISISYTDALEKEQQLQKKLSHINWNLVRKRFNSLSNKKKILLQSRIKYLIGYEIGWEKKILYKKFLDEIKST